MRLFAQHERQVQRQRSAAARSAVCCNGPVGPGLLTHQFRANVTVGITHLLPYVRIARLKLRQFARSWIEVRPCWQL
jgi:hypothetical protein